MFNRRPSILIALFASVTGALSGCKTSGQIVNSREDADPTEIQTVDNAALTDNRPKDPETLSRELEMTQGELDVIKQNSQFESEKLKAKIAELEKANQQYAEELAKAQSAHPTVPASAAGPGVDKKSGAAGLWEVAAADIKEGKCAQATSSLEELVKTYPKDKLAFQALANLGLCQYKGQHFSEAAVTFNQIIDRYPKRKELALAWFGQAAAFAQLKQQEDAKLIFEEVSTRYPKSSESALAKKILRKAEKVPADLFALARNYPTISPL